MDGMKIILKYSCSITLLKLKGDAYDGQKYFLKYNFYVSKHLQVLEQAQQYEISLCLGIQIHVAFSQGFSSANLEPLLEPK